MSRVYSSSCLVLKVLFICSSGTSKKKRKLSLRNWRNKMQFYLSVSLLCLRNWRKQMQLYLLVFLFFLLMNHPFRSWYFFHQSNMSWKELGSMIVPTIIYDELHRAVYPSSHCRNGSIQSSKQLLWWAKGIVSWVVMNPSTIGAGDP